MAQFLEKDPNCVKNTLAYYCKAEMNQISFIALTVRRMKDIISALEHFVNLTFFRRIQNYFL